MINNKAKRYFDNILSECRKNIQIQNGLMCERILIGLNQKPRYLLLLEFLQQFEKLEKYFLMVFNNQEKFTKLLLRSDRMYLPLLVRFYKKSIKTFRFDFMSIFQLFELREEQKQFLILNEERKLQLNLQLEFYQKINDFFQLSKKIANEGLGVKTLFRWIVFLKGQNVKQMKLIDKIIKRIQKGINERQTYDWGDLLELLNQPFYGTGNLILIFKNIQRLNQIASNFVRNIKRKSFGLCFKLMAKDCLPYNFIIVIEEIINRLNRQDDQDSLKEICNNFIRPILFKIIPFTIYYKQVQKIIISTLQKVTCQLSIEQFKQIACNLNKKNIQSNIALWRFVCSKLLKLEQKSNGLEFINLIHKPQDSIQNKSDILPKNILKEENIINNLSTFPSSDQKNAKDANFNSTVMSKFKEDSKYGKDNQDTKYIKDIKDTKELKDNKNQDNKDSNNKVSNNSIARSIKDDDQIPTRDIQNNSKSSKDSKNLSSSRTKQEPQVSKYISSPFRKKEQQIIFECQDYIGIENITNSCYINSFLECLFYCISFRQIIFQTQFSASNPLYWLKKLFKNLKLKQMQGSKKCIQQIKSLLSNTFNNSQQQDCMEFGRQLIEKVLNVNTIKDKMSRLFQIKLKEVFGCPYGHISHSRSYQDSYLILSFQNQKIVSKLKLEAKQKQITVSQMIQNYFMNEDRTGDFVCEYCKKKISSLQTSYEFVELPKVWIIALSRFTYDKQTNTKKKILQKVEIQDYLFLSHIKSIKKDVTYKLNSFVIHLGNNAESGHYQAYVRHPKQKMWLNFDDAFVTQNACQKVGDLMKNFSQGETPYLLFYQKLER